MKFPILVVLGAIALATSGCFGYPPDTVRPGDRVSIVYQAVPADGSPAPNPCYVSAVIGSGVFGRNVESALLGHARGDEVTIAVTNAAALPCQSTAVPAEVQRFPATRSAPREAMETFLGKAAVVGEMFVLDGLNYRVSGLNATTATYRMLGGQVVAQAQLGLNLFIDEAGDDIIVRMEPDGSAAVIQGPIAELQLGNGNFTAIALHGDQVLFSIDAPRALGLNKAATVSVTILGIGVGQMALTGGNYGQRWSSPTAPSGLPA